METERDRITKALAIIDQIDHKRRHVDMHIHLERIAKFHDYLTPEILKAALTEHLAHIERKPLDVPALVSRQAA